VLKKQAKVWGDGVIWGDVSDPSAEIVSSPEFDTKSQFPPFLPIRSQ
jgi:hypothetical protein